MRKLTKGDRWKRDLYLTELLGREPTREEQRLENYRWRIDPEAVEQDWYGPDGREKFWFNHVSEIEKNRIPKPGRIMRSWR